MPESQRPGLDPQIHGQARQGQNTAAEVIQSTTRPPPSQRAFRNTGQDGLPHCEESVLSAGKPEDRIHTSTVVARIGSRASRKQVVDGLAPVSTNFGPKIGHRWPESARSFADVSDVTFAGAATPGMQGM